MRDPMIPPSPDGPTRREPQLDEVRQYLEAGEYRNREDFGDQSLMSAEKAVEYLLSQVEQRDAQLAAAQVALQLERRPNYQDVLRQWEREAVPAPHGCPPEKLLHQRKVFDEIACRAAEHLIPEASRRFARYFLAAKWEWKTRDGQQHAGYVPTSDDIAALLHRIVADLRTSATAASSTGGLCVWREGDEVGISFEDDVVFDLIDANQLPDPPAAASPQEKNHES